MRSISLRVETSSPTIDFTVTDGIADIPIEQRSADEVTLVSGRAPDGQVVAVQITPDHSPVANYGFDVTPARLVTGLITERGVIQPVTEAKVREVLGE